MTELEPLDVPLDGTTLVEASAGTGKTYTITTLFVRLVLERPLEVGRILVVTYTNAATAELRRRVRDRLALALQAVEQGGGTGDAALDELARRRRAARAEDRERLRAALFGFDDAAIFTIHGFCQRVLHEHAFESGVAFDTELTTDQTALVEEVVRDFWARQFAAAPEPLLRALRAEHVTLDDLTALAKKAALHRDVPVLPEQADGDVDGALAAWDAAFATAAAQWRERSEAIVARLRTALASLNGNSYSEKKLTGWVDRLAALFADGGQRPPLGKATKEAVLRWSAGGLADRTNQDGITPSDPFFDACDNLLTAHANLDDALRARALRVQIEFVAYARAELRRRKEGAGVQFFDDLIHRVADALAGEGAEELAARLRERFPAALIDEFQDTDQTQYAIFRRIYHGAAGATLFLIGDPKQSIYAFRGADVFAYLAAKDDAGARAHTLSTSRRSDPRYLDAVNALFGVSDPFLLPGIGWTPMRPAPERTDQWAPEWPALQVLFMTRPPQRARGKSFTKENAERLAAHGAAREIVRLLTERPAIDGRPVEPRDIAVLCRTNQQARVMQHALRTRGVRSVLQGDASVFDAGEAEDLQRLMAALADPGDAAALRAALATPILGVDAAGLLALQDDEAAWEQWAARVQRWHERWLERSFMAAFRRLLEECDVPRRLLGLPDGERRMTNLLHLAELLQEEAAESRRGPLALVEWLGEMRADGAERGGAVGEAAQIRLESDESALTLLTIHKSKGLEFPIVFVPFAWDGLLLHDADRRRPMFHDASLGNRLVLDLGSPQVEAHQAAAEHEARAESLRLLYVALTRARHHCTVVWGPVNGSEDAAFGYLVHRPRKVASSEQAIEAAGSRIKDGTDAQLLADLRALARRAPHAVRVAELSDAPIAPYRAASEPGPPPRSRTAHRQLDLRWRTSSFTGLAAGRERLPVPVEEGLDRDELAEEADGDAAAAPLDFPGGRRAGLLVHKLFELLDGRQGAAEVRDLVARLLPAYGVEPRWADALRQVVDDALATPLGEGDAAFRLADIDPGRRLAEVEFMFPVAQADAVGSEDVAAAFRPPWRCERTADAPRASWRPEGRRYADTAADRSGALTAVRLARAFERHSGPWAGYAERLRRLQFAPLQGFLHGFIDLVFEHGGRWYVVDYKSNRLGPHAGDYRPARLPAVMEQHHYVLQYHLYTVAVHRYLERRLPGYAYDRDFGGVYYLFVRGMAPRHPPGCGVYCDRPPRGLVEALSAVLHEPGGES